MFLNTTSLGSVKKVTASSGIKITYIAWVSSILHLLNRYQCALV